MRAVFVGGCGRSGTTLLGSLLGTHSNILATPESKFITNVWRARREEDDVAKDAERILHDPTFQIWGIDLFPGTTHTGGTYSELIESILLAYGAHVGKAQPGLWLDHTPRNIAYPATLNMLFPDSRLIHVVRDGRAVASSVMPLDWGPNTVPTAARWWQSRVGLGLASEAHFGRDRAIRVRYEDLVLNPEAILLEICSFIGVEYEATMLKGDGFQVPTYTAVQHRLVGQPPDSSRADAWRGRLSRRQIEIFENIAGEILACLDYVPEFDLRAREQTSTEKILSRSLGAYRTRVNRLRHGRRLRSSIK